ncbi:hypothetical protein JTB14_021209 [Gonioctena quinquepunctata]|nr:hypothetical protein JTB14_021209 [Gonioctena quinquepunctata]
MSMYDPEKSSVIKSRDVVINEESLNISELPDLTPKDDNIQELPVSVGDTTESNETLSDMYSDNSREYNPEEDMPNSETSSSLRSLDDSTDEPAAV